MDAPLGITFFKKVELYQRVKQWDDQYKKQSSKKGRAEPTWSIEKKVIAWIYFGHKNLGSPLVSAHFEPSSPRSKLKDFHLSQNELESLKTINKTRLFENFVMHGYADLKTDPQELRFNADALLTSVVLNEINRSLLRRTSFKMWSFMWGHFGAFLLLILFVTVLIDNPVLNRVKNFILSILYSLIR